MPHAEHLFLFEAIRASELQHLLRAIWRTPWNQHGSLFRRHSFRLSRQSILGRLLEVL